MFGSVGCGATVWIAPTTSLLGVTFSACPFRVGPGPWAVHVPPTTIVTVICAGVACTFPLSSTARLLIGASPGVVRVKLKLHEVVPVAALKVAPPSTETSTRATDPPPVSLAVPVMPVVPGNTATPARGDVIVEVGGVVSWIAVTAICVGVACAFPLLSTARLLIVAGPVVVGVQLKLHEVVPVAAL